MRKPKNQECAYCRLDDCKHYGRVYADEEDDMIGDPWCYLANDALPDECYWPYDCIAREQLAEAEDYD